jgi:hypothetical protein
MTNLFKVLLIVPFLFFYNCSDDDDNNPNPHGGNNVLRVGNVEYDLDAGLIENYGAWDDEMVNLDLSLFSSGINISNCSSGPSGSGQVLYFEMFTTNENYLDDGTYTYSVNPELGTFDYADYALNWGQDMNEDDWIECGSGSVSIERSGSNYTISWDLIDDNGIDITGNFSGVLDYCDVSEDLQSSLSSKKRFK